MQIGYKIRELRQKKGFKQVEFAKSCGLSQSYLSLIEKGKKEPTLSILKRVASILEVPTPVLVFLSLDKSDIDDSKKEAYQSLEPSIKELISDVFTSEPV